MSQPYLGEIRMFGGNYAPANWAMCNGQMLSIADNDVLFALIGTTYGGDGTTTFALPDLRGRIPINMSSTYLLGMLAGSETVTLTTQELPSHSHLAQAQSTSTGNVASPANAVWASSSIDLFSSQALSPQETMNANAISSTGGNQPHDNMMPFQAVNFIISLYGIYPQQS